MECSTAGFPVLHYLTEFAQTRVHWVNNAFQPSQLLPPPSHLTFNLSQHPGLVGSWQVWSLICRAGQRLGIQGREDAAVYELEFHRAAGWKLGQGFCATVLRPSSLGILSFCLIYDWMRPIHTMEGPRFDSTSWLRFKHESHFDKSLHSSLGTGV